MADPVDRKIAALAKRQRGYVTRVQLIRLGLRPQGIKYRVRIGRLIRVYAGVYAVGHLPTLPQDRAMGALLACGPRAVLSHGSAATAWGISKRWQMPFEVTAPRVHTRAGIKVHRAKLTRVDATCQLGLRVTSPARTLLDVTPRMTDKALRRAVNDLRRPGHLHLDALADLLERLPRSPGASRLRPFVDRPSGPTRSELEDAFLAFVVRFNLPQPQTNVRVAGREVDAWFPRARVIVELDGWDYHSDRGAFEGDRDTDATALTLDIATVRVTWERMTYRAEREAERLATILRTREERGAGDALPAILTDL